MDYSPFRRSENVEDHRADPWNPLYKAYTALGLTNTPSGTIADMVRGLTNHPLSRQMPTYDGTPSAPGSLADHAGRNDLLKRILNGEDPTSQVAPAGQPFGSLAPDAAPMSRPSLAEAAGAAPDVDALRARGLEQLKQAMWNRLGVDYKAQGKFDDSPTPEAVARGTALGRPTIDYLKDNEAKMNTQQGRGEPGVDYPMQMRERGWDGGI